MNLLFSPLSFNIGYKELKAFSDIFRLTNFLHFGDFHQKIYYLLHDFIYNWAKHKKYTANAFVDLFYIHFLSLSGYFSIQGYCYLCKGKTGILFYYEFNRGEICPDCFQNHKILYAIKLNFNQNILCKTMKEVSFQEIHKTQEETSELRENIIQYLRDL